MTSYIESVFLTVTSMTLFRFLYSLLNVEMPVMQSLRHAESHRLNTNNYLKSLKND